MMHYSTFGIVVNAVSVLANGFLLLQNYARYQRHYHKTDLGLCVLNAATVLFCGGCMLYNAGKASGAW